VKLFCWEKTEVNKLILGEGERERVERREVFFVRSSGIDFNHVTVVQNVLLLFSACSILDKGYSLFVW
jgi:hypothetical protein